MHDCVEWLEQFGFNPADLEYLAGIGFDDDTLNAFGALRFTGDVWIVPDGRIVFANFLQARSSCWPRRSVIGRLRASARELHSA